MAEFHSTVDIQAPPARVWAVLLDVERWPEWTPTVTRVERLDSGPLVLGCRTRLHQPGLAPAIWQVTELDPDSLIFTWITRALGIAISGRHVVEPTPAGSRAALSVRISGLLGPIVTYLMRQRVQSYVAKEAEGLRRRSES
jgi:uncharacterized protein YndB with AHSA1/START domain